MKKNIFAKLALITLGTCAVAAFAAQNPATATFQVKMTILKACSVTAGTASDIQLGTGAGVDSTAVNTTGTSNLSVTCSKSTPYNIGLNPANASTTGAGVMSGTGGNTDKVNYQLNSGSAAGPVWGNTATGGAVGTVGNGVHGTGNGAAQSIAVFATAPDANFTPDSYVDTVTVNVTY